MKRSASIYRETKETKVNIDVDLDGGKIEISTGIGFFDHMLNAFAVHGGFGLIVRVAGDLEVDCHHTVEDTGIVLGQAFAKAMGRMAGICRFGDSYIPMDEALGFVAVDISGRPFLVFKAEYPQAQIGQFDPCMTEEFFRAFAMNAGVTLHVESKYGKNSHHIVESLFKATAHALRKATTILNDDILLSTKGVL